jgi:hypothetical protein
MMKRRAPQRTSFIIHNSEFSIALHPSNGSPISFTPAQVPPSSTATSPVDAVALSVVGASFRRTIPGRIRPPVSRTTHFIGPLADRLNDAIGKFSATVTTAPA